MSRHLLYVVLAAGLLLSCKPSVPSQFIQPGDMEDLLYDYHIAQAMAVQNAKDDKERAYNETLYFAAVLEKHGVTKADFDSSLTYYYTRADRFGDMYKNVVKRLNSDALSLGASEGELQRYSKLSLNNDTVDVWGGRLSAILMPYPPYNRIDFEQKADTSFHRGDSFLFIVHNEFIYQEGARSAEACIVMRYDNDTVVSKAFSLGSSGMNQIRIPLVENRKVKDIHGYIFLAPQKEVSTTLKLMVVKNIQLIKMRKKEDGDDATTIEKKDSVRSGERKLRIDTILKTKEV